MIKRVGVALLALAIAGVAFVAWLTYGAWPVPAGYTYPRHSIWGGPTGLFEGTLTLDGSCVRTDEASPATVVWPPGYRLAVVGAEPVVFGGTRGLRMGEPIRMGGGWYEDGSPPPTTFDLGDCPAPYFLSTGFVDD